MESTRELQIECIQGVALCYSKSSIGLWKGATGGFPTRLGRDPAAIWERWATVQFTTGSQLHGTHVDPIPGPSLPHEDLRIFAGKYYLLAGRALGSQGVGQITTPINDHNGGVRFYLMSRDRNLAKAGARASDWNADLCPNHYFRQARRAPWSLPDRTPTAIGYARSRVLATRSRWSLRSSPTEVEPLGAGG